MQLLVRPSATYLRTSISRSDRCNTGIGPESSAGYARRYTGGPSRTPLAPARNARTTDPGTPARSVASTRGHPARRSSPINRSAADPNAKLTRARSPGTPRAITASTSATDPASRTSIIPPPRRPTDSATLDAGRGSASNTTAAVRDGAAGVSSLARCTGNGPTGGTASDIAGAPAGVGTWFTDAHPRSGRPSGVRQAGESMDPVRVPVLSGRHHRRRYPAETRPTP